MTPSKYVDSHALIGGAKPSLLGRRLYLSRLSFSPLVAPVELFRWCFPFPPFEGHGHHHHHHRSIAGTWSSPPSSIPQERKEENGGGGVVYYGPITSTLGKSALSGCSLFSRNASIDVITLELTLRKARAHGGVVRGLHESAKLIENRVAQLCVLAEDCNQPDYVKLVKALCADHSINLLTVPSAKTLGECAGLCKIDSEGNARKVVGCSKFSRRNFAVITKDTSKRRHRDTIFVPRREGNAHVDQSLDFLRSVHTQLPRNQRSPVMSTTKTASSPPATASMSASKSPTTFEQRCLKNNGKHASASKIRGYRPVSQGQKRSHLVLPGVPELWESVDEEDDLISSRSGCWNLSHVHAGIRMLESGFVFYGV
ncbi:hypothetical protein IGI04_030856 [Brassica rapa subsp. trilocularis]|uniref:40S ribosomal protein S12 n=1 Tax=Brassica rapa subsp. trilocularis TaxID=1813537 RepID=A0ABQ7LTI5_BRACM|nr:hypothetical protein IGI04_030856 [Brassica rapa subsp. trilocularis]